MREAIRIAFVVVLVATVLPAGLSAIGGPNTTTPEHENVSAPLEEESLAAALQKAPEEAMWEDDCRFRPSTENYVVIVAFAVIFCLSVVGNSIVIVVIVQQRTMRSITNLYLLNLAITDLLLSVVCMPPTLVSSVVYCWMFGDLMCKVLAYLQPAVVTASAYTLASIAIERYYAICQPLHSRVWATRSHAYTMISVVWVISLFSNVPMLFMYELRTYGHNGLNCAPRYDAVVHFGYQIYMTAVLLMVPLVMMTVLYGVVISSLRSGIKIETIEISAVGSTLESESRNSLEDADARSYHWSVIRRLRGTFRRAKTTLSIHRPFKSLRSPATKAGAQHGKRAPVYRALERKGLQKADSGGVGAAEHHSLRSTHSEKSVIAKQRVIKMLVVIVIIFFCCWTPSYIWWLLLTAQDSFGTFNVWNSDLNTVITILTYLSSCTNPITYCFLNQKFRTALLLTFGCRRKPRGHFQKIYMPPQNPHHGPLLRQGHTPFGAQSLRPGSINRSASTSSMSKRRSEHEDDLRRNSATVVAAARRSSTEFEASVGLVMNNNTIAAKSKAVGEKPPVANKESAF
ncbi:hypothetical protein QR680_013182 [Steinernema hermaphroditum]|uniref:G-protein coupled receptors family 1 profile domain-containing protein n=1 Tax=Steinernema hermaphroditum TaxID=289476 RepID=A0AA39I4M7_9BILA|nr:hypothetical protein QR680_013182 [Steinernema hermaphroditum]